MVRKKYSSGIDDKTGMFTSSSHVFYPCHLYQEMKIWGKERENVEKTCPDLPFNAPALWITAESYFEDISIAK